MLREQRRWVAAVAHGRSEPRITLTYPAINWSRHIAFLVSGESKRTILRQVLTGRSFVPAARLTPFGELLFVVDRAAAIAAIAEVVTRGDMDNDVSMFQRRGFGIAMGNSSAAAPEVASTTMSPNDADGFSEAIERHVLSPSNLR